MPHGGGQPEVLPAICLLERLGRGVEALDDVSAERLELLEQTRGDDLLDAVVHRLDHAAEITRVDEGGPALAGANGEVDPERMNVECKAAGTERSMHLAQDVHDVLGLYSSERPRKEREVELALRQVDLGGVGNLEPNSAP